MPLWTIYHTPGTFTGADKKQLASQIADHYEEVGLPRFYVVTVFTETQPDNFYIGGEPTPVGVRVVIEHIARRSAGTQDRQRIARWINSILSPYLDHRDGLQWEFHVDETSAELWMINGLVPPPSGSAAEREWLTSNTATPY